MMPDFQNLAVVMHSVPFSPSPGCKPSGLAPHLYPDGAPMYWLLHGGDLSIFAKFERNVSMRSVLEPGIQYPGLPLVSRGLKGCCARNEKRT